MKKFISIIIGSKSDWSVMEAAVKVLDDFSVPYELIISSAHRSVNRTKNYVKAAEEKGASVFIAAAGMAAHLAGAIASQTTKPVIGVPINSSSLNGLDALLSTVQMPPRMPVATMAIGEAGAINAAYFAMQILSLSDINLANKLIESRKKEEEKIELDSKQIEKLI